MTGAEATGGPPLLEVEDLTCHIDTPRGPVRAVDGVSFRLYAGESLGVVGESGSGKSMTAMSILRLFGPRTRARLGGRVRFEGTDLLDAPERELRRLRGGRIGMVFQDPLTSLDPVMPVGDQIAVPLRVHAGMKRGPARARAVELLDLVGIPDAHRRAGDLPHRFSGGMRQRILIAAAVACEPRLLIADEATTALDVTVQAQVLALLARLRRELDMALVVISHDLGVVSAVADTMQVMYAGRIVERGPVADLLTGGGHPYTRGLVRLVPHIDRMHHERRLRPIPGQPPVLHDAVAGCAFRPRCELASDRCAHESPPLATYAPGRARACWAPVPPPSEPAPEDAGPLASSGAGTAGGPA
jgi:oligopeptide/dipeptide ABC transporter ATP-binding protein